MSKVSIMSQAIATKACSGLNTTPRGRNRRRRRRNTCSLCRLQAPCHLLVLALMSLLEPLISCIRHGGLHPGPARQGVPDPSGRLAIPHERAAPAPHRIPVALEVGVPDVHLLRPFPKVGPRRSRWTHGPVHAGR